jgi:predicted NAD-dependent protein-ADP-ribosyltransferase YbiA (DUF1768 family)
MGGGSAVPRTTDQKYAVKGLLTNTSVSRFKYRNIEFRTVQAAYETMKFYYIHENPVLNESLFQHVAKIVGSVNFKDVCRLGASTDVPIRKDWKLLKKRGSFETEAFSVRDCYMFEILVEKFKQDRSAYAELMATGTLHLVDNTCGGDYWSVGHSLMGKNRYGELLMFARIELSQD